MDLDGMFQIIMSFNLIQQADLKRIHSSRDLELSLIKKIVW